MTVEKIENLEDILEPKFNDVKILDQTVTNLLNIGENFLSLMLKVDIKIMNKKKGGKEETIHAVAKLSLPETDAETLKNVFVKEIFWYKELLPIMKNFENEYGLDEISDVFAEFYGAKTSFNSECQRDKENREILLLENVAIKGYKNIDRHLGFDMRTSKAILKASSYIHALSIALKIKKPELFHIKIKPYLKLAMTKASQQKNDAGISLDNLWNTLEEKHELIQYIPKIKEQLKHLPFSSSEGREPWATINHNDLWINNIMVQEADSQELPLDALNSEPETPLPKIKLVDLQMYGYHSFAIDLAFFLLSGVSLKVQKSPGSLDILMDYYYENFIGTLERFRIDTSAFVFEDFLEELKMEASESQIARALVYQTIIFGKKGVEGTNSDPDAKREAMRKMFSEFSDELKEKLWFIVEESIRRNWFS